MAYDASRLEIQVDSRSGERNLRRFEGQLNRTEQAGIGVTGAMGGITRVIGLAAAAVGGFTIGRVIRETASFEQTMLGLQAVSGATTTQMKEMQDQARTLGATTMFSARETGEAQRFLAQAGLEVNEVMSAAPGILQLATAGQLDLARAADIASNVLGGMQLEVSELNRVNDVLAATAAGSNTSIEQLGQALSFAAPFAQGAGISIEEAAAAIGTMSDAGIQASRAGTGLVGVIRQLSKVTPGAKDALAQAGLSVEDVNLEVHGLTTVLERLNKANLTSGQAIEIFGSEAGAAAQVIAKGADRVAEFTQELGDAEGAASGMADILGSGLHASILSFNSALGESVLQLGKGGLGGAFSAVIDGASGLLSVYNDMLPEFVEANDLSKEQAENLELVAAALKGTAGATAALVAVYGGIRGAILAATAAQWAFNAAVRANPLMLAVSAAALLVGGLYSLRDELGLTGKEAYQSSIDVDGLADAFRGLTDAQQENTKSSLVADLIDMRMEAAKLGTELNQVSELVRNSGQLTPEGGAMPIASPEDIARGRELRAELGGLLADIGAGTDLLNEYDAAMRDISESTTETSNRTRTLADSDLPDVARSYKHLIDQLYPLQAAQREYLAGKDLLAAAMLAEGKNNEWLAESQKRLRESYKQTLAELGGFDDAFDAYPDLFDPKKINETNDAAKQLGFTFSSAFEDAIVAGEDLSSVMDGLLKDIQRMIVRKAITENVGNAIGGVDWGGMFGFAGGGYTGDGGKHEPAGVVHGGEFVVQKSVVDQPGVLPFLSRLNKGYASGGHVGSGSGGGASIGTTVQIIDQRSGGEKPQVQETTGADGMKRIRVMIQDTVQSGMNSGAYDRTMANNWGVRRRGMK